MKKDINISKKSLIALIIVIIVLFTTTIITTTLLFARSNKQEKIDNSNLTDRQVIEYLENENYKFEKSSFSDNDSTIYTTISNDNVYLQKIVNIYLGTKYTFGNEVYNDENADIVNLDNNDNDEKNIQYSAYQKWLKEINLTDNQIISVLDYYDENNIVEYINVDELPK